MSQAWTKEPWCCPRNLSDEDMARAKSCVNALAGIRNPAAVKGLIEAAKNVLPPKYAECPGDDVWCRLREALSALDAEAK